MAEQNRDDDLTQEPEMVKAFRDTWELDVHSYLTYLRDRILLARELLSDRGSIFVQISDDNLHYVRNILDEIFKPQNFMTIISFATTSGFPSRSLARSGDYLLWYAKNSKDVKNLKLYVPARRAPLDSGYKWLLLPNGQRRPLTRDERDGNKAWPKLDFIQCETITKQGKLRQFSPKRIAYAYPAQGA